MLKLTHQKASGKIERAFRTIKDNFINCTDWNTFSSLEDLNEKYNFDELSPVDGKMVRVADHLSALLEAGISIKHGITSTHLEEGKANLLKAYQSGETINGIDAASIFKEFSL